MWLSDLENEPSRLKFAFFSSLRYDCHSGFEHIDGNTTAESTCMLMNDRTNTTSFEYNTTWSTGVPECRDGRGNLLMLTYYIKYLTYFN